MFMKNYSNCPVCEGENFNPFLKCKDNTGSDESFNIVKCATCGFAFTNPIPEEYEIAKYYESEEYISHSNTKKGIVNSIYQLVRNHTLDKKVKLLNRLSNGKNLLDIGCGTGEFLDRAAKNSFDCIGIEPSETAKRQGIENFQLKVFAEDHLTNLKSSAYDFITMWHVLEHVYDLNKRIETLKRLIKPNGHIIIAVPNLDSYDANYYKEKWAAYDVPRHLYHFSPKAIQNIFQKHRIELVEVLPMKFDSFYVSMLSEKYKNGSINLLRAFTTGLTSNFKANKEKSYSSQIYILKKA